MHILRIIIGFVFSILVATLGLGLEIFNDKFALLFRVMNRTGSLIQALSLVDFGDFKVLFIGVLLFAGLPAIILIVFSELLGWRSFWIQVACGFGIGIFFSILDLSPNRLIVIVILPIIGAVSGIVYWVIAGRFAGLRATPVS